MPRIALLLVATVAAVLGAPAAAGAAQEGRDCGSHGPRRDGTVGWTSGMVYGAGVFNVGAYRTDCPTARRLSLHRVGDDGRDGRWSYRAWRCHVVDEGYEYAEIRCTAAGDRIVWWETGA